MTIVGSTNPSGGAPKPDPTRVAAIRYTIVDEPETCATFGEIVRASLASLNERTLAETRSGDLSECSLLLEHVRDRVAALDPARLQPRTGLAGLFDSRSRRLKTFRAGYSSAASAVSRSTADIGDRAGALARKSVSLETLWSDTRDAITELDAHIAAARGWLANELPSPVAATDVPAAETRLEFHSAPVETRTDAETTPPAESGHAAVAFLPHPLETRLSALEAVRATALGRLPLLRAAQNADCRAPVLLKQVCDGVEAWRADWRDALGLSGRKPRKVRPDRVRLSEGVSDLSDRIDAAGHALSAAQGRRAELDARVTLPRASAQMAA